MMILARLKQYALLMRIDKPVGSLLLLWPCLTALLLAADGKIIPHLWVIFIAGVFLMRACGCVMNDIIDRKLDGSVARTQNRPLATGKLHLTEAVILFILLGLLALGLVLLLPRLCLVIAMIGMVLTVLYPFSKRFFKIPQLVLGVVWNLGILMSFAAVKQSLPFEAWWYYITILVWTVAYDTCYAMADRKDDLTLGINSSAIRFGLQDVKIVAILQLAVLILLALLGLFMSLSIYYFMSVLFCGLFFLYQFYLIHERDSDACFNAFLNNTWALAVIFFGVLMT